MMLFQIPERLQLIDGKTGWEWMLVNGRKEVKRLGLSEGGGVYYGVMEGLPSIISRTAVAVEYPCVCEAVVRSDECGP